MQASREDVAGKKNHTTMAGKLTEETLCSFRALIPSNVSLNFGIMTKKSMCRNWA